MKRIVVKVEVTMDQLEAALVSMVETDAVTYWCRIVKAKNKKGRSFRHAADKLLNGGSWEIEDLEDVTDDKPTVHTLTRKELIDGVQTLAVVEPSHFADLVGGTGDNSTADALLQCCLFGAVQYA